MEIFHSKCPEAPPPLAEKLAFTLKGGEVVAFRGDLGAGKTCFTRGLARGLGYSGNVNSPTFAILNEYIGGRLNLCHFDMYRISSWDDLDSSGYFECLESGAVVAAEWSENIENALPDNTVYIEIEKINDNERKIKIFKKEEIKNNEDTCS